MDELVNRISEKLGISNDTARKAVLITADYLNGKIPEPIFKNVKIALNWTDASDKEIKELGLFRIPLRITESNLASKSIRAASLNSILT